MVNFFKYKYPQPLKKNIHFQSIQNTVIVLGILTINWFELVYKVKIFNLNNLPASNLVFLIDVSGSMSDENKLPLIKTIFKNFSKPITQRR